MNKQKALNNKGFSLVELIIVIAIMAILTGILAPNFLRYLSRANESADIQLLDTIKTTFQTTYMDPQLMGTPSTGRADIVSATTDTDGFSLTTIGDTSPGLRTGAGADTTFGLAIAEQLGYATVAEMYTGLKSELRSGSTASEIRVQVLQNGRVAVIMTDSTGTQGNDFRKSTPAPTDKVLGVD